MTYYALYVFVYKSHPPAQPEIKKGGTKIIVTIKAYCKSERLIYANCNKLQSFSDSRQESCQRSCSRCIKNQSTKENRIKVVSPASTILFYLTMQ